MKNLNVSDLQFRIIQHAKRVKEDIAGGTPCGMLEDFAVALATIIEELEAGGVAINVTIHRKGGI